MKIGEKLKNRRLELGLTMREIAEKADVSEATISRWESGNIANMRRNKIVLLAKALQVTPSFIMEDNSTFTNETANDSTEFITPHTLNQSPPILKKYNSLNTLGQQKTDEYIDDLLENPKYTKSDTAPEVKKTSLADAGIIVARSGNSNTPRKRKPPIIMK